MKASVKFREDQKPLFRAKVPLSILGLPFQSGIIAGESKEFALNLGTFFESGPSVKIAYRPNDSWNPFSVVVKTGAGHLGSPAASSMVMSAEFSLLSARANPNPRFMLHFKPQIGDFSVKKSVSSSVLDGIAAKPFNGLVLEDEHGTIEAVDSPAAMKIPSAGAIAKVFAGTEVAARTSVPLTNCAAVSFRWGVRVPTEMKASPRFNPAAGIPFQKIPFLVMNKIGIEHVEAPIQNSITSAPCPPPNADLAEACFLVKHQLEVLHSENGMLKKAVDDLRREFAGASVSQSSFDRSLSGNNSKSDRRSNEKKSSEVVGVSDSKGLCL